MQSRRSFIGNSIKIATGPLWWRLGLGKAFAQVSGFSDYKAIVCIALAGGNDGNNMLVPFSDTEYQEYATLRGSNLAYGQGELIPLVSGAYKYPVSLNPKLPNVAQLFNAGSAAFVANVGPISTPATKAALLANPDLVPPSLLAHPAGIEQWQSASTVATPNSGWGGRIADRMPNLSGALPMVLNAGGNTIFTVGEVVQGIAMQGGAIPAIPPIPVSLQNASLSLAQLDSSSANQLIAHTAQVRAAAAQEQVLLAQAQAIGNSLKTTFPTGDLGGRLSAIAQLINGRSVVGASRQIFYCDQGIYDTHQNQKAGQEQYLAELDAGIAAFVQALQEMGLWNQVLICTVSDFNRTMQGNGSAGSDHAWGNHQLIVGGGIRGGRVIGDLPDLELGGSQDINGQGTWIPTLSVSQYAAAAASWIGLSTPQLSSAFPELANFPAGPISLT